MMKCIGPLINGVSVVVGWQVYALARQPPSVSKG